MSRFYLTALNNLGNTCYMNSSLQALYATNEFREYIISQKNVGPLHGSLSKLFKEMMICNSDSISPIDLKSRFQKYKTQFRGGQQHDAQEFLRFLIIGIHEEVNEANKFKSSQHIRPNSAIEAWKVYINYVDYSSLVKLFVGQFSSTVKCMHCSHENICWDTFWDLSLSLPKEDKACDISECLNKYSEDEVLDKDSMPTCSQCRVKRKSVKSIRIVKSAPILMIHLKKFGKDGNKLSNNVIINENIGINSSHYALYACVCHHGMQSMSGHYTAYCKFNSSNWYHFNDQTLTVLQTLDLDQLNDAYVLFYRRDGFVIRP